MFEPLYAMISIGRVISSITNRAGKSRKHLFHKKDTAEWLFLKLILTR